MTQAPLDPAVPAPGLAADERARALRRQAVEHAKAAMLAEFNGTYDEARRHREEALRLEKAARRATLGELAGDDA